METKLNRISKISAIIASVTVVTGAMGLGMATFMIATIPWVYALVLFTPGILGIAAGIGLFLQARWALIATMIYYLLQTIAIEWDSFFFKFHSAVYLWLKVGPEGFAVSINFVAVVMLILCLIEYKARRTPDHEHGITLHWRGPPGLPSLPPARPYVYLTFSNIA